MRLYTLDSLPDELTLGQVAYLFMADEPSVGRVLNMFNIRPTVDLKLIYHKHLGYNKSEIEELARELDAEHKGYNDRRTIEQKAKAIFDRKGIVQKLEAKTILATGNIKGRTIGNDGLVSERDAETTVTTGKRIVKY